MIDNKQIQVDSLSTMSQDQLIDLYRQGFRLSNNDNIKSIGVTDVGTLDYIWFGLTSYFAYKSYQTGHDVIAIILGALALVSAGGIYTNLKK